MKGEAQRAEPHFVALWFRDLRVEITVAKRCHDSDIAVAIDRHGWRKDVSSLERFQQALDGCYAWEYVRHVEHFKPHSLI